MPTAGTTLIAAVRAHLLRQVASWAILFRRTGFALACYERALRDDPNDTATLAQRAYLFAQSVSAADRQRAVAEFERLVALKPADADSWFNLGFLYQQQGGHVEAIRAFERAVALRDGLDRAWYGLALSRIATGDDAGAIEALKKNVALQPMSPFGFMELARAQFRSQQPEACEKTMRRLKAFDPRNAAVLEDETGIRIGIERWWRN